MTNAVEPQGPRRARVSGSRGVALLLMLACALAPGCAWANRDNRPVWNAFEENLVPEGDTAFVATLPLTVPGGLLAILLDTFIVHPASVIDEAGSDSLEVWSDPPPDWEQHYYTELVFTPVRVIFTPIMFVGSFLLRSMFDFEQLEQVGDDDQGPLAEELRRTDALLQWFERLAAGEIAPLNERPPNTWTDELDVAYRRALAETTSRGRITLYRYARWHELPPWAAQPGAGLDDPDPVVRYVLLNGWPSKRLDLVPRWIWEVLRADPNGSVRELAAELDPR